MGKCVSRQERRRERESSSSSSQSPDVPGRVDFENIERLPPNTAPSDVPEKTTGSYPDRGPAQKKEKKQKASQPHKVGRKADANTEAAWSNAHSKPSGSGSRANASTFTFNTANVNVTTFTVSSNNGPVHTTTTTTHGPRSTTTAHTGRGGNGQNFFDSFFRGMSEAFIGPTMAQVVADTMCGMNPALTANQKSFVRERVQVIFEHIRDASRHRREESYFNAINALRGITSLVAPSRQAEDKFSKVAELLIQLLTGMHNVKSDAVKSAVAACEGAGHREQQSAVDQHYDVSKELEKFGVEEDVQRYMTAAQRETLLRFLDEQVASDSTIQCCISLEELQDGPGGCLRRNVVALFEGDRRVFLFDGESLVGIE